MKAPFTVIALALATADAVALVTDDSPLPAEVAALAKIVAAVNRGTGVYLGDRRMVTAAHVEPGLVTFGDTQPLRFVAGSWRRIDAADLAVFQLEREPDVPALRIRLASVGPREGELVWLIATGWRRGAVIVEPKTGKILGWQVVAARQLLAGRATVADAAAPCPKLKIPSICFRLQSGAQAVPGDSGGGAFVFRRGGWELVGIISHGYSPLTSSGEVSPIARSTSSYAVDVASYREWIAAALGPRWSRP